MNDKIWLSSPHMGGTEQKYVNDAFVENWIAPLGPNVNGFEADLEKYTGVAHAAALSSGTAALHLALILLGVGEGDDVICQSFTFSASANPIVYCNATPVFVDSESDTWNMCPIHLEEAIKERLAQGRKVKAIIPVHLYGMPAKMDEICAIAKKYDIAIVEDAAEGLGSKYKGKPLGAFGKFGVLSFNGNKIITTSGGGALLSDNMADIEKARFLATQARDNAPHYEHTHIGYNYRMSNICAGIGRGQMEVLDDRVNQRRAVHNYYMKELGDISAISFLLEPEGFYSNRWLSCILIDPKHKVKREDLRLALNAENIESRPLWKPMHLQPVFMNYPYYGNGIAETLFNTGLCLPSGSNLSESDLERVVTVIRRLFK
ncbi:pyridoxal phosphate-dependent aminotransferase [Pedobacter lusitanus]|uniref:GDP-perosamine synthase n=1 Tax=Pedobacter lusitanus TaxID=1503925 RepID=A0A0D0GVY0_9SPHI|nr:aminotransferase class I/II-fold pyridoxal phosphate-dependent enzyme [Pedobacter lusitanus]KIO78631.1 pyridoxal phosphate-dependent aminotransferase [Pedobacter lusitanus]